jgi:hypothetical protein
VHAAIVLRRQQDPWADRPAQPPADLAQPSFGCGWEKAQHASSRRPFAPLTPVALPQSRSAANPIPSISGPKEAFMSSHLILMLEEDQAIRAFLAVIWRC